MKKKLLALSILLSLSTSAFSETYPKITYTGGHPDLQAEKVKGGLNVLSDHVEFVSEGSQAGIKIPYETVEKVSEVHVVGGRPFLKTTAWVAGIVLIPFTFGTSLIPAVGMTGLKTNGYYVSVEYKDDVALSHAVNFQVKDANQQLKIKADIENQVYKYRKALKEAKQPGMTASNPAPVEESKTPETAKAQAPAEVQTSTAPASVEPTVSEASKK